VVWQANGRRLSVENFDRENVDELIKIRQYSFPPSKICAIRYTSMHTGIHSYYIQNIAGEIAGKIFMEKGESDVRKPAYKRTFTCKG